MLFSAAFSRQVQTRVQGQPRRPCWGQSTWVEQDSNLRRQCHQIYSLAPLAAWVSTRLGDLVLRAGPRQGKARPCGDRRTSHTTELAVRLELTTYGLQNRCSAS